MSENSDNAPDRIEKLWQHFGNMDADQIREHIRRVRMDRRVTKVKNADKKTVRVKSDAAKVKARSIAAKDPDMIRRLLEQMNGKG